jgi:hypothetical protein
MTPVTTTEHGSRQPENLRNLLRMPESTEVQVRTKLAQLRLVVRACPETQVGCS